jgi:hypothetical protein
MEQIQWPKQPSHDWLQKPKGNVEMAFISWFLSPYFFTAHQPSREFS